MDKGKKPEKVCDAPVSFLFLFYYLSFRMVGEAISQEILSGLADVARTHWSAIARGERKPTSETLCRISVALDMNMSDLVKKIEQRLP